MSLTIKKTCISCLKDIEKRGKKYCSRKCFHSYTGNRKKGLTMIKCGACGAKLARVKINGLSIKKEDKTVGVIDKNRALCRDCFVRSVEDRYQKNVKGDLKWKIKL